ncbi:hypothetical protein GCM10018953_24140 [Streptosporangium nondiastaticum]
MPPIPLTLTAMLRGRRDPVRWPEGRSYRRGFPAGRATDLGETAGETMRAPGKWSAVCIFLTMRGRT